MRYLSILFIFSLLAGCAVNDTSTTATAPTSTANTQTDNEVAPQAAAKDADAKATDKEDTAERLVCHTENVTGSNRKVRTCRKVSSS